MAAKASADLPEKNRVLKRKERDFSKHLEDYLAKRDGVDKLLKILRYVSKIVLASPALRENHDLYQRLKSFESSVGVSRKAFRLGKFVQDLNALKKVNFDSREGFLGLLAYGGEGIYYFVEQFVWLAKTGLIDPKRTTKMQKISAYAEILGYIGSISLKTMDLSKLIEEEKCFRSKVEKLKSDDHGFDKEVEEIRKLREKQLLKKLSIVQDVADSLMAFADIQDGKGALSSPLLIASAGLLSALISAHKNWLSC